MSCTYDVFTYQVIFPKSRGSEVTRTVITNINPDNDELVIKDSLTYLTKKLGLGAVENYILNP